MSGERCLACEGDWSLRVRARSADYFFCLAVLVICTVAYVLLGPGTLAASLAALVPVYSSLLLLGIRRLVDRRRFLAEKKERT